MIGRLLCLALVSACAVQPEPGAALDQARNLSAIRQPPACAPSLQPRPDAPAEQYTHLLATATAADYPYAEVTAWQLPTCVTPDAAGALLAQAAFAGFLDMAPPVQVSAVAPGGGKFLMLLDWSAQAVAVHVASGDVDPAVQAQATVLLDALRAPLLAHPEQFVEVPLKLEADECTQLAVALVRVADGQVWIVRRFPLC